MIKDGDIDAQIKTALDGSVFDDYGTMMLMRSIGSVVMAILLLLVVFYPLYTLLWRFLKEKFPAVSENLYLKKHKANVQDAKDYAAYLKWAESNNYEPLVEQKNVKKKNNGRS